MLTKNIFFKNFKKKNKKINKNKKILLKLLKNNFQEQYQFLNSLTSNYKYSYKKKDIKNFNKFSSFNLIGMGGSTLGSEAIYNFLDYKIKKKFYFFNNLENQKISKSNNKTVNIIISKSGNTLETIANFNFILKKQNKNKNIIITEKKIITYQY